VNIIICKNCTLLHTTVRTSLVVHSSKIFLRPKFINKVEVFLQNSDWNEIFLRLC